MRPPRRYGQGYREAGWATAWKESRNGWELKLSQLAGFDLHRKEAMRWGFCLEEIATMYMDYLVNQMHSYDQVKPPPSGRR